MNEFPVPETLVLAVASHVRLALPIEKYSNANLCFPQVVSGFVSYFYDALAFDH